MLEDAGLPACRAAPSVRIDWPHHRRSDCGAREKRASREILEADCRGSRNSFWRALEILDGQIPSAETSMTAFPSLGDGEQILLVLAIVYISECACWLPQAAVCFSATWRQYRTLRAAAFLRNDRGGLVFFGLTPFSRPLICQPWPLCMSPDGIRVGPDPFGTIEPGPPFGHPHVAYDEIRSVERRHLELLINARPAVRCASTEIARLLAESLPNIVNAPRAEREAAVDAILFGTTDTNAIRSRLTLLRTEGFVLTIASTSFFLYTFLLGYLLLCVPQGLPYQDWIYFGGLTASWLVTVFCFWLAHRRIFPGQNRERRQRIAMMLLVPTEAMRAPATLSRNLLLNFHPLAVAAVLCSPHTFGALAKSTLLSLNHLARCGVSAERENEDATSAWFYARMLHHLTNVVRQRGLQSVDLLRAPAPDPDALSYCPRCHAQFVVASGVCRECRNLPLIGFAARSARS
jgi:hypothetical protein